MNSSFLIPSEIQRNSKAVLPAGQQLGQMVRCVCRSCILEKAACRFDWHTKVQNIRAEARRFVDRKASY